MIERKELQRTGEMLLPSIAYGDAAGLPVETKSYRYIADFHGEVDRLLPPKDNIFFEGDWPAGTTSDDTQLSVSVARALIRANGFAIEAHAAEHTTAYNETQKIVKPSGRRVVRGWGTSTTNAMERIVLEGVSPTESGEKDGRGNGILMKMAPLVYWQVARGINEPERYRQYDQLTTMTHDGDVARICTRVHGDMLHHLLTRDVAPEEFGKVAYMAAEHHEKVFGTTRDVTTALDLLTQVATPTPADVQSLYADRAAGVTERKFGFSYSFYAPETLMVAYAAFLHGQGDFHKSVYTAVNLGGDADSTASIVGGMQTFATRGAGELPQDAEQLQGIDTLHDLSAKLATVALKD